MKRKRQAMICHLGTSGWSYPGWVSLFYPEDLSSKDWLSFYSQNFSTVEINMTFYRFPKPDTLKSWLNKTPPNFTFTLKANRQITHLKKIRNVQHEVRYFYILANSLKEKLGCILFQLPPSIHFDLTLLQDFLASLSPDYKNVIEFRHESWYQQAVYDLLRSAKVTFCIVSSAKVPGTVIETADTAYVRFHGLTGEHRHNYTDDELKEWAEKIKMIQARECYIYFNNDYQAYAVTNAKTLEPLLR
jgi:uncharacterized protein YecE (DUF72 family)